MMTSWYQFLFLFIKNVFSLGIQSFLTLLLDVDRTFWDPHCMPIPSLVLPTQLHVLPVTSFILNQVSQQTDGFNISFISVQKIYGL